MRITRSGYTGKAAPPVSYMQMAEQAFWSRLRSSAPSLAIVALGVLALANRHAYLEVRDRPGDELEGVPPVSQIQEVYPEAAEVADCDSRGEPCRLLDEDGEPIAQVIFSAAYVDDITGYGGPVSLAIEVDDEDTVRGLALIDHSETPSFVEDVREEELLARWDGLAIDEAVAHDVDVVSGATMTSRAIIETVRETLGHYVENRAVPDPDDPDVVPLARQILTVLFLVPGVAGAFSREFRRRFETPILLANVIVLGFVARALLSLSLFQGMILHGVDLVTTWHLLVVLAVFAAVSLATGTNVWCTRICPYGSFQALAARVGKRVRLKLPRGMNRLLRRTRPLILAGSFVAAYVSPGIDLAQIEPFAAFVLVGVPVAAFAIALTFLVISVVQPKLWCRSFCPTGVLLDTLRIREQR